MLAALTRLQSEFPALVEEYARNGFRKHERVRVLPTEHVYEFDGVFDRPGAPAFHSFFRLKVIDPRRSRWDRKIIRQPTFRSFPVNEILRLQRTDRIQPRGKQNSDLGHWQAGPLDRLLGIRSGGNTSLFRNHVLLLTSISDATYFAETSGVASMNGFATELSKAVTWGRLNDDGVMQADNELQGREQPLIAVTHAIDLLADACEQAEPYSKNVFIDGVTAITRNLQAFDRIVACQRPVIVADHDDVPDLSDLSARHCMIWELSRREILGQSDMPEEESGQKIVLSEPSAGSIFAIPRRAAVNVDRLRVTEIPVRDQRVEVVAALLMEAERDLAAELDDAARRPLGLAFGLLLEISSWFAPPSDILRHGVDARLDALDQELRQQTLWLMPGTVEALCDAATELRSIAQDPTVGATRLNVLREVLSERRLAAASVAIVTRTAAGAQALATTLLQDTRVRVYSGALLPSDIAIDTLVIASWLRSELMTRTLNWYAAPDIRLLAGDFESRWLRMLLRSRRRIRRSWGMSAVQKAAALGLTDINGKHAGDVVSSDTADLDSNDSDPAYLPRDSAPVRRLEAWSQPGRKGRRLESAVVEHDMRSARYIGFVGRTYAYVTPGRALPVVSELLRGLEVSRPRVVMRTVEQLRTGEYVLFRDQGEHDVISLFAEQAMGEQRYRELRGTAESWKELARSIAPTVAEVYKRLRAAGSTRQLATVRGWLTDPDRIGPASRDDLSLIVQVSGKDSSVVVEQIWDAILDIRGAHIVGGQRLSEFLISELPKKLKSLNEEETLVDLTLGHAWIVEVEDIGDSELRSYTEVNRLLWDDYDPNLRQRVITGAARS